MRILAIIGAAVAAVALSIDAASGAQRTIVREGGTFRAAALAGWFSAIDPALTGGAVDASVLVPACEPLMGYPDKPLPAGLHLQPDLAVADPVLSKDRRTYTFTIRKGVRFSNGAILTAADFKHTFERIFDPAMKSTYVGFAYDVT